MHERTRKPADIGFISNLLVAAGWSQVDIFRLQKNVPQASSDYYNAANGEVENLAEEIKIRIYDSNGNPRDVAAFLAEVVAALSMTGSPFNPYSQPDYLRALGVLVYCDEI